MKYQELLQNRDSIVVIGAGAMGSGIAQVAASAGHSVVLHDSRSGAAAEAVAGITRSFMRQVERGRMQEGEAARALGRIKPTEAISSCVGASLVIEAIVENLSAKRALFNEIEELVRPDTILATNTSSFSVTRIAEGLRYPERLVGMHFFNPAPVMQLVEIVSGLVTEPEVASAIFELASSWGKVPVHAKSSPGFIVNRVARPYYAEGLRLLTEGAADTVTLDAVMRECGGFVMGPFELMDLIGHDVNYAVTQSIFEAFYGDRRFTPSLTQLELVNAGQLGRKSGHGFYDYGPGAVPPPAKSEPEVPAPAHPQIFEADGVCATFVQRLANACNISLSRWDVEPRLSEQTCLAIIPGEDYAVLYLSDGRTATDRAAQSGRPNSMVLDLALDYAQSRRIAIACADQCSPRARAAMVGLLQRAGWKVTVLDDVAGLAVLRTVCMLSNEAADAVLQGVCDAEAVDLAMRKGVNYPEGPLRWAERIGFLMVCQVLQNLQLSYGEDRYRTSPWLRRKAAAIRTQRAESTAALAI